MSTPPNYDSKLAYFSRFRALVTTECKESVDYTETQWDEAEKRKK